MVVCGGTNASCSAGDLRGVLNNLIVESFPAPSRLIVAVGTVLTPDHWGRRLDLMTWRLGSNGDRLPIPGHAGCPIYCPRVTGPSVHSHSIDLTFSERGIYGFELFDRDGAFGKSEALLATYIFGVDEPSPTRN
jgi:hypothetical protein